MPQAIAGVEILDHKPAQDESLFRDTNWDIFRTIKSLGDLSIEHTPPAEGELSQQFDDILHYSRLEDEALCRWRYPDDSGDIQRVFTPWYGTTSRQKTKSKAEQLDTRLHIRHPALWAPQPIIHVEKRLRVVTANEITETVYEGHEILLHTEGAKEGIIGAIYDGTSRHRFNLRDTEDLYAFDALRAIRQAHALVAIPAITKLRASTLTY